MRYAIVMRYAQGGGLTAERRAFRERLRIQAAGRFAAEESNAVIARELRVSVRSVQRWRKAWSLGGERALASKGPASLPLLSDELFAVLECQPRLHRSAAPGNGRPPRLTPTAIPSRRP